ncbi:MAG: hypothetical protein GXO35_06140 [Gammaproteobacteria bacterium]|nr:hypothetical protein [Gammaproteobacteria bacterium]
MQASESPIKALPVHLITGLLGSGKTTTLRHLLSQKPPGETWGLIINEFGEIDIDAATLQGDGSTEDTILSVSGGCVCCTAQHGLTQAINQLIKSQNSTQTSTQASIKTSPPAISRIWIEPTGLGHPARMIDTLTQGQFIQPLQLQKIICVITPQQLTELRWQKSQVMRDLVTLSDVILLNKTDSASREEISTAHALLQRCVPPKMEVTEIQYGSAALPPLLEAPNKPSNNTQHAPKLTLLSPFVAPHKPSIVQLNQTPATHLAPTMASTFKSQLPGIISCLQKVTDPAQSLVALGWVWHANIQFNRVVLKQFFEALSSQNRPSLTRAKGLLKTGNEWQLINWVEGRLHFEDIAWRKDSRLELLFEPNDTAHHRHDSANNVTAIERIENQLLSTIHPSKPPK